MKKPWKTIACVLFIAVSPLAYAEEKKSTETYIFETIGAAVPYRYLAGKDPQGFMLELDDGSTWRIPDEVSAHTASYWLPNDPLVIHPVLFSKWAGARFYLYNERTKESAYAELSQGPYLNKPTHNVISFIDYRSLDVQLCDGLQRTGFWHIDSSDRTKLSEWKAGETVILGSNENCYAGWFSSSEYILINVERGEFVRAYSLLNS